MAMVMGGIEDERCFSNLGFVKSKPRNILTTCLNLIVRIFAYKFFYLWHFPICCSNECLECCQIPPYYYRSVVYLQQQIFKP
jgi:hypothetical protein